MDFSWCLFQFVAGIDCPACGLTRSILALLEGNWTQSVQWHPMGIVVVLWFINLWWFRRMDLAQTSRKLISHGVLLGFFVPWVVKLLV